VEILSRPALAWGKWSRSSSVSSTEEIFTEPVSVLRSSIPEAMAGISFSEVECDLRAAGPHVPHLAVRDDLEFHHRLMRRSVQLGGFQQAHIVGPVRMPHQVADERCGRRTPEIQVLGRNDDVEAVAQVQKPIAFLQFFGGVEEGSPIDAKGRGASSRVNTRRPAARRPTR
jgi:hypothetical protein